ncbi:type VI secretion system baseplate subunit TssE [Neorhizobium huautlense]|uniref:type VI secretion system baseplate subunit TssE n=1 Tax=Neorhizobium huautlense TaxID=67774 RepID=UPI000CF9B00C|nr:type VI secretion system baseplate subunit TssE [Neorhizobium huautlense]
MTTDLRRDIVQPSLLDRLTDDEPSSSCETQDKRSFSIRQLQEVILRDVSWLLNTDQLASSVELDAYPLVAASTLNYGVRPLSGHIRVGIDPSALRDEIAESLQRFEPRLLPHSIKVMVFSDGQDCSPFRFKIAADLWALPVPLRMTMRAQMDPEQEVVHVDLDTETS